MKPSEIWKEIKPRIGEMLVAVNDIETRAEKAQEEAYQRGLNDAWEAARKIIKMPEADLLNLFTECYAAVCTSVQVFLKYDASEAIEKIRQYEQEQKEIQVGDEVFYGNTKGIVIRPEDSDRYASVFTAFGEHISAENKDLTKTGRHFPEIAEVLQKMKES